MPGRNHVMGQLADVAKQNALHVDLFSIQVPVFIMQFLYMSVCSIGFVFWEFQILCLLHF